MKHVTLSDVRPRRHDSTPYKTRGVTSIHQHSDDVSDQQNFAIVQYRYTGNESTSGIVQFITPSLTEILEQPPDMLESFKSWENAESHIQETYEQPDTPNEVIQPLPLPLVEIEAQRLHALVQH